MGQKREYPDWSWDRLVEQVYSCTTVDPTTSCRIWDGWALPNGRGRLWIDGEEWYVTRALLYATTGELHEHARHSCDNPPCVLLEHLSWGTPQDNSDDMVSRGRSTAGDRHYARQRPELVLRGGENGQAVLSDKDVERLRQRYAAGGTTQKELAEEYGIQQMQVSRIVRGERWAHRAAADVNVTCQRCGGPKAGGRANQPWCRSCRDEVYLEAANLSREMGYGYSSVLAEKYGVPISTVTNWAKRGKKLAV